MARGNTYKCATCDETYQFCSKCSITQPTYDAERFCSKKHAEIFAILSKHGCGLATPEETLAALEGYDLTGVNASIAAHIESLKPVKVEEEKKEVETSKKFRTKE